MMQQGFFIEDHPYSIPESAYGVTPSWAWDYETMSLLPRDAVRAGLGIRMESPSNTIII